MLFVIRVLRILAPNPGVRELEGTNTWIVGANPSIVIDPGPEDEGHLRDVAREAGSVGAILLTHDHPGHAHGASSLSAMTDAMVFAFRPAAGGGRLRDGQDFQVGGATIHVLPTPGHSPDHVAFFLDARKALFTGDAVLGRGASVIDPPGGDLSAHLRSLRRMRELSPHTIHPGHGPIVLNPAAKLDEYLEDRAMREDQVIAALGDGPRTPEEMVPLVYGEDYGDDRGAERPEVLALAARSVLAHLLKLESEGRVERRGRGAIRRWSISRPRACVRCGQPVRGRARMCGPCSLAVLQESG
jgi:glyoxylase-like metal-dependent hydrolase (beta-lactamase superfamily II)